MEIFQPQPKDSWRKVDENGDLPIGVPCVPFNLIQYNVANGQVEKTEMIFTGRKFPLLDLRKKLLASNEKHMQLHTDEEISAMSVDDLRDMMSKWNEISPDCERVKKLEHIRSLALWHGVVMVTQCTGA